MTTRFRDLKDPVRTDDRLLAECLEMLDCGLLADDLEFAESHDAAACMVMAYRELLDHAAASPEAFTAIHNCIVAAADRNWEACQLAEARWEEEAKQEGAAARAAGLIAAEDIEFLEHLRAIGHPWAESFEGASSQEVFDNKKRLLQRFEDPESDFWK